MKTIPKNNHHLLRMFTAQAIRPRSNPLPSFRETDANEIAGHDFLVLSTRPDLTPQLMTAELPQATNRAS
jgi:hypothetical protein